MTRQRRILLIEDEEKWISRYTGVLNEEGFDVQVARNSKIAKEAISSQLFHLLLIDILLPRDEQDKPPLTDEGMHLLQVLVEQGLIGTAFEVIMLTAYGKSWMRDAFQKYKAVNYYEKVQPREKLIEMVKEVFEQQIRINYELEIHWTGETSPEEVARGLKIDGVRVQQDTPLHSLVALEVEDILCRVFHAANSIIVKPLIHGHSGAKVYWVQPFFDEGPGQADVLKFGGAYSIRCEYDNFEKYVKNRLSGMYHTTVKDKPLYRYHIGAIRYSLVGASEPVPDFGEFYSKADVNEITSVLNRIFRETCGNWYASSGNPAPHNLFQGYQKLLDFDPVELQTVITSELDGVRGKNVLRFNDFGDTPSFTNPVLALEEQELTCPTYYCITHGDFNSRNILIDNERHTWLIDFRRTGIGHILRDIAQLDTVIRFQLLRPEHASLRQRFEMEKSLSGLVRFGELDSITSDLFEEHTPLKKAFETVLFLRKIARRFVEPNPVDNISEYYIGLIFFALDTIRYRTLAPVQREHALLSACLLTDQLSVIKH